MSVLDEIRKLEEQKEKLLEQAKKTILAKAEAAVAELNEIGFNYKLVQGGTRTASGTRRTGIRKEVLEIIKKHPAGIGRADILVAIDAKGDKSAEQSVSNALSALKNNDSVTTTADGKYKARA